MTRRAGPLVFGWRRMAGAFVLSNLVLVLVAVLFSAVGLFLGFREQGLLLLLLLSFIPGLFLSRQVAFAVLQRSETGRLMSVTETEYRLTPEGIHMTGEGQAARFEWWTINRVHRTRDAIMMTTGLGALYLPERGFASGDDMDACFRFCRRQVEDARAQADSRWATHGP